MSPQIQHLLLGLSLTIALAWSPHPLAGEVSPSADEGAKIYQTFCAACHAGGSPEAPRIEALKLFSPEKVIHSLNQGVMSTIALPLTSQDIRNVSYFLTGKQVTTQKIATEQNLCSFEITEERASSKSAWPNWGGGAGSKRYQDHPQKINKDQVANLELLWAFGFPDSTRARSQPLIHQGIVYIGSQEGTIYALDAASGCTHWTYSAAAEVRGSLALIDSNEKVTLFFGDFKANAYSLDAKTGELNWQSKVHQHPLATITGSVAIDERHVYVPVSSSEVVPAAQSEYPCCTFRGAVTALSIHDGKIAWQYFTVDKPELRGKNSVGANRFGPSGAPVWSSPTVDSTRGRVIITTGQNYSSPATGTSDSVIALDAISGEVDWITQVTKGDAWNGGCSRQTANCPEEDGPDFDIGASAVFIDGSDSQILAVGQKSGMTYGLDPSNGKILWQRRVGSGGTMGGVHWGMATDDQQLFVGVSDLPTRNKYIVGEGQPGLQAIDPFSGELNWRTLLPNTCADDLEFFCFPGISAAVSNTQDLVFAGGLDGKLRAFEKQGGKPVWEFNTFRKFPTVNGIPGQGGAIEADGPVIAEDKLFVTSGYDKWGEMPGNVLLVFGVGEQQ